MIDLIWQLVSIACVAFTMLFCLDQIFGMRYSFYHILIRMLFYADFDPADWLVRNLEYVGFLLMCVGHTFALLGLLEQLKLGQIHDKSYFFYASSPMNSIGFILSIVFILKKHRKRFFSKVNA